ncbi:glycosyltransferase involved in cell wall biosynthesis [Tenacibaculum skagerrakense]|uniref:Glycosyltransferase involved in cell wall biosynthesis n=1 Tax=Tenacibaculum skagerrakense TaxID=186571 RepID=A0A4R2NZD2_9FLAO|nr:glycosyltransferase family 4 protein [Tenacibaculum skagerrakense]TCP27004.1 glycosyltransferase involved in cell wall biosynthesis [Tenacibaculum skagerrakense]
MRIGMILDDVFPPDPRVENEAIELIKDGHEVFLFCLNYKNQKRNEEVNGIKVIRYNSNKLEYKLSALAYSIPLYTMLMKKKVKNFLRNNNIDIIHCHDIRVAEAVFQANKSFKLPVVLDIHDNIPENMKFYPHLQKFPGKYIISPKKWKQKEQEFIEKASYVISVSPQLVSELKDRVYNPQKVVLVSNTISTSFYLNAEFDEELIKSYTNYFTMLYLGDTHTRRGLLLAIEAVSKLKDEITNIKLVIVGSSTTDYMLKNKVQELVLEDYVDFKGWRDVKLFPSFIKASDVCLSPLHRSKQHDVAYANKIFQYMSFGKPLLVSNATAQKEMVEQVNSGLVHEDRDVNDFVVKLLKLYNNPELRNTLGKNGENFVRDSYTWDKTSNELKEIYKTII